MYLKEKNNKRNPIKKIALLGAVLFILIIEGPEVIENSSLFKNISSSDLAIGGSVAEIPSSKIEGVRRLRTKQSVLSRREEIIRYKLRMIEVKQNRSHEEEIRRSRDALVMLLQDQEDTNEKLADFFQQMWEADGMARVATMGMESANNIVMSWPVTPRKGISATFGDTSYKTRFGISHQAIDIPVRQKSDVLSAADGVVSLVANNGMGYSYIIVRHEGFATLYGHVNKFLVKKGDEVREGDVIALSGGAPGTLGAGALTTGPHVHFELISGGEKIDPMPYLPYSSSVKIVRDQ